VAPSSPCSAKSDVRALSSLEEREKGLCLPSPDDDAKRDPKARQEAGLPAASVRASREILRRSVIAKLNWPLDFPPHQSRSYARAGSGNHPGASERRPTLCAFLLLRGEEDHTISSYSGAFAMSFWVSVASLLSLPMLRIHRHRRQPDRSHDRPVRCWLGPVCTSTLPVVGGGRCP